MRKQRRGEPQTTEEQEAIGRWQRLSTSRKIVAVGAFGVGTFGLGFTLGGSYFGRWRQRGRLQRNEPCAAGTTRTAGRPVDEDSSLLEPLERQERLAGGEGLPPMLEAGEDELICLRTRRHGASLAVPLGEAVVLGGAFGLFELTLPWWPATPLAAIVLIAAAVLGLRHVWLWEHTQLVVTTEKLFVVHGNASPARRRGACSARSGRSRWSRASWGGYSAMEPSSRARWK